MLTVELIYDRDCPNVKDARAHLLRAFAETGLLPQWQEWDRGAPESPAYVRTYGSPTILVNGRDVADAVRSTEADSCRLYVDQSGQFSGVPSVAAIVSALVSAQTKCAPNTKEALARRRDWRTTLATLSAIGAALLPICPACWPAYVGLLSSLGLGFVNYAPYLLPLTTVFLILSVTLLGYRAKTRRGYQPLALGIIAAAMVMLGKFVFLSDLALYAGMALLVGASLWNAWPQQRSHRGPCPACLTTGPRSHDKGIQILSERR